MNPDLLDKITPAASIGKGVLKNPQDLCLIPNSELLAVADDSNGLVIFSLTTEAVIQHIRECVDAGSVCFDQASQQVVVSVSRTVSKGDETPGELHFFKINEKALELSKKIEIPTEPKVEHGYVRWLTANPNSGDLFLASGDNKTAALWKYSASKNKWTVLLQRIGDLEHPCVLPPLRKDVTVLVLTSWTNETEWTVQKLAFDGEDKLLAELPLINDSKEIREPWSIAVCADSGVIFAYDYLNGFIWALHPPDYNPKGATVFGGVKAGQWVSMKASKGWLWVSCSDQQCVLGFR